CRCRTRCRCCSSSRCRCSSSSSSRCCCRCCYCRCSGSCCSSCCCCKLATQLHVDVSTALTEFRRLLLHTCFRGGANLLRNLHAAKLRTAHGTEVRDFRPFGRQSFIVVCARSDRI